MKVINWLFGSFFRTIGRTIAILLMGGLLYYILASNGIGISDLFLDKVKASTYGTHWGGDIADGSGNWPGNSVHGYIYSYKTLNTFTTYYGDVTISNQFNKQHGEIYIHGYIANSGLANQQKLQCDHTTGTYNICDEWNDWNDSKLNFQIWIDSFSSPCEITFNENLFTNDPTYLYWTATCRSGVSSFNHILYQIYVKQAGVNITVQNYQLAFNRSITYEITDSQAIIENQNQNTQDIINNQNNQTQQMLESNTTQAESEAESFFGNFTTQDHGGLSAIINAPLNTIRSLLSSSCTNLILPLPFVNQNITLPCMNDIYTQHFGLFFTLYQTIILAIISYRCLRSLFFDITGFTNPDDDRIEVMDL